MQRYIKQSLLSLLLLPLSLMAGVSYTPLGFSYTNDTGAIVDVSFRRTITHDYSPASHLNNSSTDSHTAALTPGQRISYPGSRERVDTTPPCWETVSFQFVSATPRAVPNRAPSISWHTIPSSVNSGQSYTVRASGSDPDGNLQTIRVWKGSSAFAFTGVSGSSGVSDANSTSDSGPKTVTFYAQAVDNKGATSSKISRNVTINAPPNHAPSVSWHTIPSSVASGQSYVVRASGYDSDGNLKTIRVWKGSSAFAFTGVSGSSGVSDANSTSDSGPRTVTFYAQAVDHNGATSSKISRNVTIQAPPTYSLSVRANSGGSASGSTSGLAPGNRCAISASPSSGYRFAGWSKSGPGSIDSTSAASTAITMGAGNMTVTASFALDRFNLTVNSNSGGSASGSASNLTPGTRRSISASPSTGYHFTSWSKSGPGSIDSTSAASTAITMGAGNITVTANFAVQTYRLTVNSGSGGSATGSGNFAYNSSHGISASPAAGYAFSGWTKSGPGTIGNASAASTSFRMGAGNATVTANFAIQSYAITVTQTTGGTVTGSGTFVYNTTHPITASPQTGYQFTGWTKVSGPGSITSTSMSSTTFRVGAGSATLRANFAHIKYTLSVSSTAGGSATGSRNDAIYGGTYSIEATPDTNFRFTGWTKLSGSATIASTSSASTTVTIGANNVSIRANFASMVQAPVSSSGGTITYGETFTPVVTGGSGGGDYQISWGTQSNWASVSTVSPSQAGSYQFYARKTADLPYYIVSNVAGPYVLVVQKADQGPVSSSGGYLQIGDTFNIVVNGGDGTGAYQMSWDNGSTWVSAGPVAITIAGNNDFYVRRAGDVNYNVSAVAGPYTVKALVPEPRDIEARVDPTQAYQQWFEASDPHSETFDVLPNP